MHLNEYNIKKSAPKMVMKVTLIIQTPKCGTLRTAPDFIYIWYATSFYCLMWNLKWVFKKLRQKYYPAHT